MNGYRVFNTVCTYVWMWTGPAHIIAYWRWRGCFLGGHSAAVTSYKGSQEGGGRKIRQRMDERQKRGQRRKGQEDSDGGGALSSQHHTRRIAKCICKRKRDVNRNWGKVGRRETINIFAGMKVGEVQGGQKNVGLLHKAGIRHRSAYQIKRS